ncbi:MAG: response regulator, partial [Pedobacter sp.]
MKHDIIIIEDEVDLGNVISEYLKLRGFSVLWFKTATDTLEHYRQHQLDNKLLIVDIQLPDMNGFDLSTEIMKLNPNQ